MTGTATGESELKVCAKYEKHLKKNLTESVKRNMNLNVSHIQNMTMQEFMTTRQNYCKERQETVKSVRHC